MRRKKQDFKDDLDKQFSCSCPGCGRIHRARKGDKLKLHFKCKSCWTKFEITIKRKSQAELEQEFIEHDEPGELIILG